MRKNSPFSSALINSVAIATLFLLTACNSGGGGSSADKASTKITIPLIPDFISNAPKNGKKLLIHYETSFEHDDSPGCVAFNVAFGGLAEGYDVEMFYDAAGVYDLKVESDGRPHSYGYEVPSKLKKIMSELYPIKPENMPKAYRDYLYWLNEMGVKITYNGFMANLVDLQDSPLKRSPSIEKITTPLSLKEFLNRRQQADSYLVY